MKDKASLSAEARRIIRINSLLPAKKHPFNSQNSGGKSYARWQFEKGKDTIVLFLEKYTAKEMFSGKRVLDMGCGAGGKSMYYATLGASSVVGADIVPDYKEQSAALAESLGLSDKFTFVLSSADSIPYPDKSFDTVIMNDFMEHVSEPEKALREALRLLDDGGRIYVNFSPYYHPYGAHLWDAISIPWVHVFFSEKAMIEAYKYLISSLPDREYRENLRITRRDDGSEYLGYINKMTIARYYAMLDSMGIVPVYKKEVPLRPVFTPLARMKSLKEKFVRMVVTVIEKK